MRIKKKAFNCTLVALILLTIINSNFSVFTILAKEKTVTSTKQIITTENNKNVSQYQYQDKEVDVLVTLKNTTDLPENAVLNVSAVNMDENMTEAVNENIADKKVKVENKVAYDISFLVDGKEVEPLDSVDVKVNLLKNEAKTAASVYHYDEKDKSVDDMNATLTPDKVVAFSTTHFSTYIIVNTSMESANVTLEHYNETYTYKETTDDVYPANAKGPSGNEIGGLLMNGKTTTKTIEVKSAKIYETDQLALQSGSRISNYAKAVNWEVSRVVQFTKDVNGNDIETEIADINKIYITEDAKFRVYYKPISTTKEGNVKFYDYTVKPAGGFLEGINSPENYKLFGKTNANKNRITISSEPSYPGYSELTSYHINVWTGQLQTDSTGKVTRGGAVPGIIVGLTDDYSDVKFGKSKEGNVIDDPNLFNDKGVKGKTIYSDYKLSFSKYGDRYTLETVKNKDNVTVAKAGTHFFPLDNCEPNIIEKDLKNTNANFEKEGTLPTKHNDYFSMRYDVKFTIGDYVGPLNYMFSGDDDLWVILDGKKVVIDLGGIHNCLTASVDLWDFIKEDGVYDKNKEHTLTILYMERGAADSDCRMNFTLPNASIVEVVDVPKANLNFKKANSENVGLSNATFKLTNDDTGQVITATSNEQGTVALKNLQVGTYSMVETNAPAGYTLSDEKWVIKVTTLADGKNAVANLYKADGSTSVDNNTIINYTNEEIIKRTLSYDKTATVKNWDSRTYDINLEASSKATSTIVNSKPYDIVMVLDRSSSMNNVFDSYIEYKGNAFVKGEQYFYKTTYGMYQLLNIDYSKSNTKAIFMDTENSNELIDVTLGVDTVYVLDSYEKFVGDTFKSEKKYYDENNKDLYYYEITGSYFYKTESGKYARVRFEGDSNVKGFYLLTETGTTKHYVSLNDPKQRDNFYINNNNMSKNNALIDSANTFVKNVAALSPDSRISIVDYSRKEKVETHTNSDGKTMLRVGSKETTDLLKKWITNSTLEGNTRSDLALQEAYDVFENKDAWEKVEGDDKERKTMVVFFTDGIITDDSGSYSPSNAIDAGNTAESIRTKYNATIYALGVFDAANMAGSLQASSDTKPTAVTVNAINTFMKSVASPNCYTTADSADSLKKLFTEISTDLEETLTGATITDVIDSRFELTRQSKNELIGGGATVTENADGTTTVTWKNQTIKHETEDQPGWSHKFTIIAKSDYVGGNDILTNGPASYIEVNNILVHFPMPKVNVKTLYNIKDQDMTIFFGEGIPNDADILVKSQEIIDTNVSKYKVSKDAFTLTWRDEKGVEQNKKWSDIKPTADVNYIVTFTYAAGNPSPESNKNTTLAGNVYYSGDIKNNYIDKATATFKIHVVKGQIAITKVIDKTYTNIEQINANQTFIFKIERYDVDENNAKKGDTPLEVYYETINFDANDKNTKEKTKFVSGLKKGYYTITEESSWSSKYQLVKKSDNYDMNSIETTDMFIGECLKAQTSDTKVVYYGLEQETYEKYAEGNCGEVTFTNELKKNWKWLSDTSAGVNVFNK